ncbi:MAG: hypothetical protein M1404_07735 [Acidobacteria bacterium]|nr:hypothetical protein [Acidobacteriota bacterium]
MAQMLTIGYRIYPKKPDSASKTFLRERVRAARPARNAILPIRILSFVFGSFFGQSFIFNNLASFVLGSFSVRFARFFHSDPLFSTTS